MTRGIYITRPVSPYIWIHRIHKPISHLDPLSIRRGAQSTSLWHLMPRLQPACSMAMPTAGMPHSLAFCASVRCRQVMPPSQLLLQASQELQSFQMASMQAPRLQDCLERQLERARKGPLGSRVTCCRARSPPCAGARRARRRASASARCAGRGSSGRHRT